MYRCPIPGRGCRRDRRKPSFRNSRAASANRLHPGSVWDSPSAARSSRRIKVGLSGSTGPAAAPDSLSVCPWGILRKRRRRPRCNPSMSESLPVALLIEDEPQIRRFVRTALEAEGWNVHETDTVRQGLIDAGTRKPELIILDLGLPDGDR